LTLNDFTSIGRPVDPRYPSNRALIVLLIAVAVVTHSFHPPLAVFFAWALCRELDPDHDGSAFVAAGLTLLAMFRWRQPDTSILFWLLCAVRVVNRTVGLAPTWIDSTILLALAWCTHQPGLLALTALAFAADAKLRGGQPRQWGFAAAAAVLAPFATGTAHPDASGLLGLLALLTCRHCVSRCDCTPETVDIARLRCATGVAAFAALVQPGVIIACAFTAAAAARLVAPAGRPGSSATAD
jgi:hypothetical protein